MREPKSHGNGVIDQKKCIVRGHEAKKKKNCHTEEKNIWSGRV